jgi:hypothetical protein
MSEEHHRRTDDLKPLWKRVMKWVGIIVAIPSLAASGAAISNAMSRYVHAKDNVAAIPELQKDVSTLKTDFKEHCAEQVRVEGYISEDLKDVKRMLRILVAGKKVFEP